MISVRNVGMNSKRQYTLCVEWKLKGSLFEIYRSYAPNEDFSLIGTSYSPYFLDVANLYEEKNKF